MSMVRLVPLLITFLMASGCGSLFKMTCAKPEDFANVEDKPALKIPPGYDAPDTRAALTIPPLENTEMARPSEAPCLDQPPKFNPAPPGRSEA